MRFLRRSLVGLFLMSVTLACLGWAGSLMYSAVDARMNAEPRSFPPRERVSAVNVATIQSATVSPVLTVFGELRASRSLDIRAAVGGTVEEVSDSFVEGGDVRAGDWLIRIDPSEAEYQLAQARADLSDAEAEVRDAERALTLARDELTAAEGQAALRQQALSRQRDLQARGVGTAPELEAAELAVSSAEQALLGRRQAIAQAEARIALAATRLERNRLSLAEAERVLAGTEITAAFDGRLAGVTLAPGGRVAANEQIAQLIDPTRLEVSFRLSASQYATLLGPDGTLARAPLTISLDVGGLDLTAQGRITREAATVGAGQTGRLIFGVIDAAAGFRPGDFVTVRIEEPALENVALIPSSALGADNTVLVIGDEDRLSLASVTLLRRQGDDVLIRAPDLEGVRIVAERTPLLGAGLKVRPLAPPGEDQAAAEPEMIELDEARRALLIAFVEGNTRMPAEAKTRVLAQLAEPLVPAAVVARLEGGMGG